MRVSNKLRSFFIILLSIVVVMAALPLNALRVNADGYLLKYHGNGGERAVTSPDDDATLFTKQPDDTGTVTVDDNSVVGFVREGYVFAGWNEKATGDGATYSTGTEFNNITADIDIYAQWAAERTITFDANYPNEATGIAGGMDPQVVVQGISTQLDANSFSCKEYYFTGWNTDSEGAATGTAYTDGDNITAGETDIMLFAQWAPKTPCTITFDPNPPAPGATVNGTTDNIEDYQGNKVTLTANAYTCNGYIFRGWNTASNGSGEDYSNCQELTLDSSLDLYAQWEQGYIVSFESNGGTSGSMAPVEVTGGTTDYEVPDSTFTRDGCEFAFWRVNDPVSGQKIEKGDTLALTGDTVLYAVWYKNVELHSGSTTVTQQVIVGDSGQTILPVEGTFTAPDNKTFFGWTTTEDGNTIEYKNRDSITMNGNSSDITELYAQWCVPITIVFDKNDSTCLGTANGSMDSVVIGTQLLNELPPNGFSFTDEGYSFGGWKVDASIKDYVAISLVNNKYYVQILDEQVFNEPTTITLYAVWNANEFAVTIQDWDGSYCSDGTIIWNNQLVAYNTTPYCPAPTRPDTTEHSYTFAGWKDISSGVVYTDGLPVITKSVTYQATYEESNRQYEVTAAVSPSNAGTITVRGSDRYSETAIISVEPAVGYHVQGWTNNSVNAGTEENAYSFEVTENHNVVVYLVPDPHTVNVTTSGGGDVSIDAPEVPVYGDEITVTATAYSGYHFVNWVDKDGNEVSTDSKCDIIVTNDNVYKAVFELNTYEINMTSEAHGSASGSGTYTHFDTCTAVATPDTGYHFAGWKDPVSGEIVISKDYPSYSFTVEGSRDLVATFEINQYSITVTAGEHGSAEGGKPYINHFEEWTVKATPDEGYHFLGWVENGTIVSKDATYTFTATSNRSLEAVFEVNMYTVTYKDDNGKILQQSEFAWGSNAYYQKATPTKDPTAQYTYTFSGWDNKVTRVTGDVTYTAVYDKTINQYTVTFKNEDGKVLQTGLVDYGTMPAFNGETPVKAATVEYTYTFAGWDQDLTKVTGDITYTATYTAKKFEKGDIDYVYFKVVFDSNGGSEVVTQLVQDGYTATVPEDPMRERYNFAGWYLDAELTKPFSFSTVITSDITLYAKWVRGVQDETEITYAVVGDGTVKWDESNTEGGVVITIDRSQDNETGSDHFKGLQIDGEDVAYFKYELIEESDGSTSIKLSDEILNDLEPGTHTVTIVFDDGTAIVDLVIEGDETPTDGATEAPNAAEGEAATVAEASNAAAGPNYLGLWIAIGVVAFVCVCAAPILIIKRRGVK